MVRNVNGYANVVTMERHICGANLASRWNRGRDYILGLIACGELAPYGMLGRDESGTMRFTRDVDTSKADFITDLDPWHGRKVVCFDMDEVEQLERVKDVQAPLSPPRPTWEAPKSASPAVWPCPTPSSKAETIVADARIAELEAQLAEAKKKIESEATPLDPRKRNTLLTIIAASLCPNGNLSPLEERGQAGTLKRRLENLGLSVTEKVVKNTLKEVAEFARERSNKTL